MWRKQTPQSFPRAELFARASQVSGVRIVGARTTVSFVVVSLDLTLPLRDGAAEPVIETRRADARVCAGGEALIVQLCAEVECLGVCGHLPCVSVCTQESSDEFVETYPFGTGQLDGAVRRFSDCDVGEGISDVIRHDGL